MLARGYICQECDKEFNGKATRDNRLCNKCKNNDPIFYLGRKIENALKKDDVPEAPDLARWIIQKYKAKSALSENTDPKQLCATRIDPTKPWSLDNAILVTYTERKNMFLK